MTAPSWGDYLPFDARISGPLRELPRAAAEDHFARLMAARHERRAALAALAARHGVAGVMDLDDADAPAALGAWLGASLAAAGRDAFTGADAWRWTGVVADVALWLGDRVVARAPAVRWELCASHKKATGYQRPVLVGFGKVADRFYYVDVAHMVASWAQLAARGRPYRADFLATIEQVTLADA